MPNNEDLDWLKKMGRGRYTSGTRKTQQALQPVQLTELPEATLEGRPSARPTTTAQRQAMAVEIAPTPTPAVGPSLEHQAAMEALRARGPVQAPEERGVGQVPGRMAVRRITPTAPGVQPVTPEAGDFERRISEAANLGRQYGVPGLEGILGKIKPGDEVALTQAEAAIRDYGTRKEALRGREEVSGRALQTVTEATEAYQQRLAMIEGQVEDWRGQAAAQWNQAIQVADEYAMAAKEEVGVVLEKLDSLNAEIRQNRDFGRAHAMQSIAQAVKGSMQAGGRRIAEQYGKDSPEYIQWEMGAVQALSAAQSNIHATYQQMEEVQGKNILLATSEAMVKMNMYRSFQEQQHVEVLQAAAVNTAMRDIQAAQLTLSIEQLRMAGQESLANWIDASPVFFMDTGDLVTVLADIVSVDNLETLTAFSGRVTGRAGEAAKGARTTTTAKPRTGGVEGGGRIPTGGKPVGTEPRAAAIARQQRREMAAFTMVPEYTLPGEMRA